MNWFPVWTPDGRRVIFGSWRGGGFSNLYIQEPGTAEADRLTQSGDMQLPTSITRDGTTVIFTSFTKRIEAVRLDAASARPQVLVDTPREERNAEVSPDGHWIAYEGESASQPGRLDVYVRPFPDTASGLWQVTTDGGFFPAWRRDSRELFYYKPDGTLVALPVEASDHTWSTGQPKDLFKGPYLYQGDGTMARQYDVTADGQRFLMLKTTHPPGPSHFVLVQNFVSELKNR
jgi:Tol biopolymer transport system component